ncbi:MAG: DNA alkylation repair protein [Planctomycetaceae bacterium]|nr:DNA alkylation repair protein [Planctomycetaceae bacterium]
MQTIIKTLRKTLKAAGSEAVRTSTQRFFKEEIKVYGIKSAEVKKIAKLHFAEAKHFSKEQVFGLCETLMQSGYYEEFSIACVWMCHTHKDLKPKDWSVFDHWVDAYITNWAACDVFCGGTVGTFLEMYPQHLKKLKTWAKSKNLWKRRAAAVSLVWPARTGLFHETVFELAEILLLDSEDMVQKGYGWMLKEAANFDQQAVFQFVMQHKAVMPRTALRYAIEKMPKEMKQRAMAKEVQTVLNQ